MSAHTPGPWRFDIEEKGASWPGRYRLDCDVLGYGMDGEEGIYLDNPADARLLAAAPEMYEFVRAIRDHDASHLIERYDELARAILAKIDGAA